MNVTNRLKFLRKEQFKLSQAEMAKKLGIKQSYYSEMERGVKEISSNVIKALVSQNNVSLEWLFNGNGDIFTNGNSVNGKKRFFIGGDNTAIKDVSELLSKMSDTDITSKELHKKLLQQVAKHEDKGLYFHLKSHDDIKAEKPEVIIVKNTVSDFLIDIDVLMQITDIYFIPKLTGFIEYTNYEDFKEARKIQLESLVKYHAILLPLHKAMKKFINDFKQFDTEKKINFFYED